MGVFSCLIRLIWRLIKISVPVAVVGAAYWAYELGLLWEFQGGISKFCYDILEFQYDQGGGIILAEPFVQASWVKACKGIFNELGPQQRAFMENLFDQPLPAEVLTPRHQLARSGRVPPPVPPAKKEELREGVKAASPRTTFPQGPPAENITSTVVKFAGGMTELDWLEYHKYFEEFGPPSQEPIIDPADVGRALREGRMARFDATKVLPPKTFNVTLDKLSALHGPEGDDISILAFLHESKKCRMQADQERKDNPIGGIICPDPPTVGEVRREYPNPERMPLASRIALGRLPNYVDEHKMIRDLGVEGVERPEGQIILGHANGDTHWDEQDNIFIQVSGVCAVFGLPPEYSDAIDGGEKWSSKSSGQLWHEWLRHDKLRNSVPWFYMVMKPGDALAIPSRAFHAVYGGHNRASIQTFLEPKFKGMIWPTNPHSYWHKETDTRQAIRNLYFKTIGRLWETEKLGVVSQGGVIEYL